MRQFSSWYPLTESGVESNAPDAPAAIQIRREGGDLVAYPTGKSAMVCYYHATRSARAGLRKRFSGEIAAAGSLGLGRLEWRYYSGDDAREHLLKLLYRFERSFGALPTLNQPDP